MPTYRTSFTTATARSVAFDHLSRFSSAAEWDPGVVHARDLTPGPVVVGSRFEIVTSFLGRSVPLVYEVRQLEHAELVVLQAENATIRSTDTIRFAETTDGATSITYTAVLETKGITRLFDPFLALAFRRIGDRAAAGLRTAVDALDADGRDAATAATGDAGPTGTTDQDSPV